LAETIPLAQSFNADSDATHASHHYRIGDRAVAPASMYGRRRDGFGCLL
jgi:hypothetical protein